MHYFLKLRFGLFIFNNYMYQESCFYIYFNLLFILFSSRGPYSFDFNSGAVKFTTTAIPLYRTQGLAHLTWLFTRFLIAERTVMDAVRLQGYLGYHNIVHTERNSLRTGSRGARTKRPAPIASLSEFFSFGRFALVRTLRSPKF